MMSFTIIAVAVFCIVGQISAAPAPEPQNVNFDGFVDRENTLEKKIAKNGINGNTLTLATLIQQFKSAAERTFSAVQGSFTDLAGSLQKAVKYGQDQFQYGIDGSLSPLTGMLRGMSYFFEYLLYGIQYWGDKLANNAYGVSKDTQYVKI